MKIREKMEEKGKKIRVSLERKQEKGIMIRFYFIATQMMCIAKSKESYK